MSLDATPVEPAPPGTGSSADSAPAPLERTATEALFALLPGPAWAAALVLTTAAIAVYFTAEAATGRIGMLLDGVSPDEAGCQWLVGDYRISALGFVLWGYTAVAFVYLRRFTAENLQTVAEIAREGTATPSRLSGKFAQRAAGLAGVAVCTAAAIDISERPLEWTSEYWILPHAFNWFWCLPFGWLGGRFLFAVFDGGKLLGRSASLLDTPDPMETRLAPPFARQATESVLLLLIFLGLMSVHFVDPGAGAVAVSAVATFLAIGGAVALLPMLEYRRILGPAKARALQQVRDRIQAHGRNLVDGKPNRLPEGELADLVLMEQRLEQISLSPIAISGAPRLLLYVLLGIGSWLGAAMVERILDGWLG